MDRSAPLLPQSQAIQVPNSPTKVEEQPGGSWDCVAPPTQDNPVMVLGKSWDCVGEDDISRTSK